MRSINTIYNSIDTYNVTPDYDCKICFEEYKRLIELILTFFDYINIGLLDGGIVRLKKHFSFYLTMPMEYTILGIDSDSITISSVKAQRIDIMEYDWGKRHDSAIQGIRLWIACHMSNPNTLAALNGQIGREQPIVLSAEWLPVQNIQQIADSASTGIIDLTIPRHGLFAIRLHKIKSKKPIEIIESPYLYNRPDILYML
jgi:hypothetical protein